MKASRGTPVILFFTTLLMTAQACLVSSCNGSSSDKHCLPDTVNVAVELSAMTLSTGGDTISGFSYELMQAVLNDHKLPFKLHFFNNISEAMERPEVSHYNLFISNLPVTTRLKEDFIVTQSLYLDRQVLVQNTEHPADSLINSQQELADRVVWVAEGSSAVQRLQNLAREIGSEIVVVEVEDVSEEQLVILVSLGEIPRAAVSGATAEALKPSYPHLNTSTDLSFNQFKAWFLNPVDSILRDSLDMWIDRFKTTVEYSRLVGKYDINTP